MAKGEWKVQNDDDSSGDDNASNDESGSDSDEEFESPSYDDLVKLLNQYTKIIRKTRAKNEKLELEKDSLLAKYDIDEKASVELREENKIVSSKLKELKSSKKDLREKHDKLEGIHNEITTSYNLLKKSTPISRLIMTILFFLMSYYSMSHMMLLTMLLRLI